MGLEVLGVFLQRGSALQWRVGQDTAGRTIPFGITWWCFFSTRANLALLGCSDVLYTDGTSTSVLACLNRENISTKIFDSQQFSHLTARVLMELLSHQICNNSLQRDTFAVGVALLTVASLRGKQCNGSVCYISQPGTPHPYSMLPMQWAHAANSWNYSSKITVCKNLDPHNIQ